MSIKDDFAPYRDGNGLMAPNPVPTGTIRGSDNGSMFTSEYYIMLNRNGQLTNTDGIEYADLIEKCIGTDGNLHRAPGDETQDEIDDHLGVLAGYAEFNDKANFGLPLPLMRFPQLTYAWALAKGVPALFMSPLLYTIVYTLIHFTKHTYFIIPAIILSILVAFIGSLNLITAIILGTSCIGAPVGNTDDRRLNWDLWQATKRKSVICNLAGLFWHWRQTKVYGTPNVMKAVAALYYQPSGTNPYSTHWID